MRAFDLARQLIEEDEEDKSIDLGDHSLLGVRMVAKHHRIRDLMAANKLNLELDETLDTTASEGRPYSKKNTGGGGYAAWIKDNLMNLLPPGMSELIVKGIVPIVSESLTESLTESISVTLSQKLQSSFFKSIAPPVTENVANNLLSSIPQVIIVRSSVTHV
jgi:hypothetical protein